MPEVPISLAQSTTKNRPFTIPIMLLSRNLQLPTLTLRLLPPKNSLIFIQKNYLKMKMSHQMIIKMEEVKVYNKDRIDLSTKWRKIFKILLLTMRWYRTRGISEILPRKSHKNTYYNTKGKIMRKILDEHKQKLYNMIRLRPTTLFSRTASTLSKIMNS
jgi:hypothetical protein